MQSSLGSVALSVTIQTYVEADRAMGISSIRTFFTHFMPRLTPVSIAYTALGIPGGILLAQTLAFLGIQPPNIVTWEGLGRCFRPTGSIIWMVVVGALSWFDDSCGGFSVRSCRVCSRQDNCAKSIRKIIEIGGCWPFSRS